MMNKKILLALVIVAAAMTGYVLIKDSGAGNEEIASVRKTAENKVKEADLQKKDVSESKVQANNSNNQQKSMELQIQTTQEGTGEAVKAGDKVSVLYTGKLEDGTVFDASSKHGNQPFEFTVGAGMVIKGWDQGLLGAKVGEKRSLTIPSDLAYGPQGIPGVIPGGATLVFEVEVLAIK